jgi:hypothetical protein
VLAPCHLNELRGPVTTWKDGLKPLKMSHLQHRGPQQACNMSWCRSQRSTNSIGAGYCCPCTTGLQCSAVNDDPDILHMLCTCTQPHTDNARTAQALKLVCSPLCCRQSVIGCSTRNIARLRGANKRLTGQSSTKITNHSPGGAAQGAAQPPAS